MSRKDNRLWIRIEEKDYLLLKLQACKAKMTVSAYLRMMVDTSIRPLKDKIRSKELSYEECETILNDKLQFRKLFKK